MVEDDFLDEIEEPQETCETCKSKRGRKKLKDTLSYDEISIEEEKNRIEAEKLLDTRQRVPVSELEHNRMLELRLSGMTLEQIGKEMEFEFGKERGPELVLYHTDKEYKDRKDIYSSEHKLGYDAEVRELSEHSKEYADKRQNIITKFRSLGTPEDEIRDIMLAPVWAERGKIVRDVTFDVDLLFTKFEEEAVKAANELNDKEHLNTILARSRLTPFDVQKFKRKLEEYGMNHYADAITLAKVKKAKKDEDYDLSEGNWDRVDSSLGV